MTHKNTFGRNLFHVINYSVLTIMALSCLLPFVNQFAISLSSKGAVAGGRVLFWPVELSTHSYQFAFFGGRFMAAFWVAVQRLFLGVAVNLSLIALTAYPLSKTREQFAGRNIYMGFFVLTMIVNGGLVPTYVLVSNLGLLNNIWSLVLPGALPVFSMIILMNFIRGLPKELEEAALVDGASPMLVLFRIMLPLLRPSLATVALFSAVYHWNEWFTGMIYMSVPNYPLQTYLQSLLRNLDQIIRQAAGNISSIVALLDARGGRAAQLFLSMVPIMLTYPLLQKHFTKGLTIGSVKG